MITTKPTFLCLLDFAHEHMRTCPLCHHKENQEFSDGRHDNPLYYNDILQQTTEQLGNKLNSLLAESFSLHNYATRVQ